MLYNSLSLSLWRAWFQTVSYTHPTRTKHSPDLSFVGGLGIEHRQHDNFKVHSPFPLTFQAQDEKHAPTLAPGKHPKDIIPNWEAFNIKKTLFDSRMNMNSQKEHMHAGMCGPIQAVWFFAKGQSSPRPSWSCSILPITWSRGVFDGFWNGWMIQPTWKVVKHHGCIDNPKVVPFHLQSGLWLMTSVTLSY